MSEEATIANKRGWFARLIGSGDAQALAAIEAELVSLRDSNAILSEQVEQERSHRVHVEGELGRVMQTLEGAREQLRTERAGAQQELRAVTVHAEELRTRLEHEAKRAALRERDRQNSEQRLHTLDEARAAAEAQLRRLQHDLAATGERLTGERDAATARAERAASERDAIAAELKRVTADRDKLAAGRERMVAEGEQQRTEATRLLQRIAGLERELARDRSELAGLRERVSAADSRSELERAEIAALGRRVAGLELLLALTIEALESCVGPRADWLLALAVQRRGTASAANGPVGVAEALAALPPAGHGHAVLQRAITLAAAAPSRTKT